jgi:hypothetical protein
MEVLMRPLPALLCGALVVLALVRGAGAIESATEYQVKAVFLYNFSHFVEWPPEAFTTPTEPFVIGILGSDPFGARMDEAVHGELINQHPMVIRRFSTAVDIGNCQILYIDRSHSEHVKPVLAALDHRNTLTVADLEGSAGHGVMIELSTENNRIRLRRNADAAKTAGLTISSKLLRPAEIVSAARD